MTAVTAIPPSSRIGARTPSRCMRSSISCTLYVSLVRRAISEDFVYSSVCAHERENVLAKRSWRSFFVTFEQIRVDILFAVTLPTSANSAHMLIMIPQKIIVRTSRAGAHTSSICESIHGRRSSTIVPPNFMIN